MCICLLVGEAYPTRWVTSCYSRSMKHLFIFWLLPVVLFGCPTTPNSNVPIGDPSPTASIVGDYKSSTFVQIEGYSSRNLDTEIKLSVSGNDVTGSAVYIEVNPPPVPTLRAPARTLLGVRNGSQVTFTQQFSECNNNVVTLTGTVQTNGDIKFPLGKVTINCPKSAPIALVFTFDAFTLVKQ
jgi:hypothetical protein